MTTRKHIAVILLWALSLVIVAAFAHAQTVQRPVTPTVLSGSDIGFRVTGRAGDHAIGTLVVRINGEWVEAQPAGGFGALTSPVH
jgi:hypothetical protein